MNIFSHSNKFIQEIDNLKILKDIFNNKIPNHQQVKACRKRSLQSDVSIGILYENAQIFWNNYLADDCLKSLKRLLVEIEKPNSLTNQQKGKIRLISSLAAARIEYFTKNYNDSYNFYNQSLNQILKNLDLKKEKPKSLINFFKMNEEIKELISQLSLLESQANIKVGANILLEASLVLVGKIPPLDSVYNFLICSNLFINHQDKEKLEISINGLKNILDDEMKCYPNKEIFKCDAYFFLSEVEEEKIWMKYAIRALIIAIESKDRMRCKKIENLFNEKDEVDEEISVRFISFIEDSFKNFQE